MKQKKKVAATSIAAHQVNHQRGLYFSQKAQALAILAGSSTPLTARDVYYKMKQIKGLEYSSAHRTINQLKKDGSVVVTGTKKCPVTNKTVTTYQLAANLAA